MPRKPRIVIPNYPHHITQRGSRKMDVFFCDADREIYMQLFTKYAVLYGVDVIAYCLMKNHVHLILVPHDKNSLSKTLKLTHMRYASLINAKMNWSGHLWQQRFFSSPMDEFYFWHAVRYVEQNPVRANIVNCPCKYQWSSASSYQYGITNNYINAENKWSKLIQGVHDYNSWISTSENEEAVKELRENTRRDLPSGNEDFIKNIESLEAINLNIKKRQLAA